MIMRVVFPDGSYIVGDRKWWFDESFGTHHFIVKEAYNAVGLKDESLTGERVAIQNSSVKYFVIKPRR